MQKEAEEEARKSGKQDGMRFNFKHRKRMTQTSINKDGSSFHGSGDPAGKSNFSAAHSRGNGGRKRVRLMVDDESSKKSASVEKHTSEN